jgi:hypothetical protein
MRTFVLVMVLLGVAGIVQMRPSPPQRWFGVITEVEPGEWIRVANDMGDPGGMWIALTKSTRVDGGPRDLRLNARVQILYSHTGGGPVARRVIILPDDPRR